MRKNGRKIIFSDREHTKKGIFSSVLAFITTVTLVFLIFMSYKAKGEISPTSGAVAFLCTLFSAAGIIIGLMGKNEPDKFYFFAYLGITWNVIDLLFVSAILYAGI